MFVCVLVSPWAVCCVLMEHGVQRHYRRAVQWCVCHLRVALMYWSVSCLESLRDGAKGLHKEFVCVCVCVCVCVYRPVNTSK